MFCRFKNLLGEPGKGFHAARFAGLARNDLIGTLVIAWLLARVMKWGFVKAFLVTFIVATFLHLLFCVDTAFIQMVQDFFSLSLR
jgi:hypothetical protein